MLLEGGLDWRPLSLSPKDMDFIAAKHAAARDIALALGVPPMLLGIPGDNTYSNYSEAQRAFWRGTVLPLVSRMAKAFSAWLAPAYGGGLELRPDLDQVDGLSAEREALWARIDKVSFLTLDEKRAAVGYGPALREAVELQPTPEPAFGGEIIPFVKHSPDQPRVPAGNEDGGQWTDGGGGGSSGSSGRVRVAQVNTGTTNDAGEEDGFVHLAQARGRNQRSTALMRYPAATLGQETRLLIAEAAARDLLQQVRARDPNWSPRPNLTSTIEGAISAAEANAREAQGRLAELGRKPTSPRSLDEAWGSVQIVRQSKSSSRKVAAVSRQQFDDLLGKLTKGAKEITPAENYYGLWYRRADGTTIGLRRSGKSGLTIDIIDSLGSPALRSGTRIHFDD